MSILGDIGRGLAGVNTLGLSELAYFQPKEAEERGLQRASDLRGSAADLKRKQLELLGQMQGPQMSPEMARRLQALEEESKSVPLSQDPYFQGQRAQVVSGGREALADVQNKQRAYGIQGGFRNVGSVQDIQDRIGVQLAGLGAQATAHRDAARDTAASARQDFINAQTAYNNAVIQAKMAIEAGDTQAAQQAINLAYQAREAAANAQRQTIGQILGTAATVGANMASGGRAGNVGGSFGAPIDTDGSGGAGSSGANPISQEQQLYALPEPASYSNRPWAYSRG